MVLVIWDIPRVFAIAPGSSYLPRTRKNPCFWSNCTLSALHSQKTVFPLSRAFPPLSIVFLVCLNGILPLTFLHSINSLIPVILLSLPYFSIPQRNERQFPAHGVLQWNTSLQFPSWPGRSSKNHAVSSSQFPSDLPGCSAWLGIVKLLWSSDKA